MVRTLFERELRSRFFPAKRGRKLFFSLFSTLFFTALFVSLIVFVDLRISTQLQSYSGFNRSFYDFVLFIVLLLGIVFALPTMHSSFFPDEKERIILGSRPVSIRDIVLTKSAIAFVKNSLFLLVTYLPLSCVYGALGKESFLFYFLVVLFLPLFSLLLTGIGLLFLVPYHEVFLFLKSYPLLSFLLTICCSFLLAYLYSLFLGLFVDLIQNSSLDMLFTTERMESMKRISHFLYPTSFLSLTFTRESGVSFLFFFLFLLFFWGTGYPLLTLALKRDYKKGKRRERNRSYFALPVHLRSPEKALLRKELSLVLSRSDGFFSFVSLVAVEPFLIYLVVSSINVIFQSGNLTFIRTLFPNILLLIDVLLILLFLSIINATSSLSLKKEGNNILTMKTLPVSPKRQLLSKMAVPLSFSLFSYLVSLVVLLSTKEISLLSFFLLIAVGFLFLLSLSLSTLHLDLRKSKGDFYSLIVDFLLPLFFVLLSFVLTLLPGLKDKPEWTFYGFLILFLLLLSGILLFLFLRKSDRLFLKYEGGRKE